MKRALNVFAMVVGYGVVLLWLLGALGAGQFTLRFEAAASGDGKTETCVEHKPWLMSRKYLCTPAEAAALKAEGVAVQSDGGK